MGQPHLAIIGAGPTGLDATLAAADQGWSFTVYEAGPGPAAAVRSWGHIGLFTPWSMNVSPRMARHLDARGATVPTGDGCPTGQERVDQVLAPVADLPELAPSIRFGAMVTAIGRQGLLKHEEIATPARADHPFRLLVDTGSGEELATADIVLDCSGTYGRPNSTGDGGIPAAGEHGLGARIVRTLPDMTAAAGEWAGQRVLLVGSGHSAQTAAGALARLAADAPGTEVVWAVRAGAPAWGAVDDDPLPERARLVDESRRLAAGADPAVQVRTGVVVEALAEQGGRVAVTLRNGRADDVVVDRVLSLTGYVGNNDLYRQLQVHECYATAAPINLSAALLGAAAGDCLQQESHGVDVLRNPEPNFFILGAKSYGRVNQFLLRVGWEQVDEVFGALAADTHRVTAFTLVNADWNFWPDGWAPPATWAACAALGFDAIEVGVYDPDVELAPERVKEAAELMARYGLGVNAALFSMPPARWPAGALASPVHAGVAVRSIVETARRVADLGASVLGVWPGADLPGGDGWARTVDSLASIADEVAPLGLTVGVEPKPGQVVASTDDALRLCREADRPALGVLLDTAHALAGGEALAALPALVGPRLVHVHLGDAVEGDADADLPPGAVHDFGPFLLGLAAAGYSGALSFDLYGAVSTGGLTGEEASRRGLAHVTAALAATAGR